jgi:hypothetical protein
MEASYLPAADKVLVSRGSHLKLVSREAGGRTDFFQDPAATHFGNRITSALDEVRLFITPQELRQLLTALDWTCVSDKTFPLQLLHALKSTFDGCSVLAPYTDALLAVASLIKAAVKQVERIEEQARIIATAELSLTEVPPASDKESTSPQLNIIDSHKLLSVLTSLGDQLHQVAQ